MNTIKRSLRGITRSPVRTILLVVLLTVSLSMALIMLVVSNAFSDQIDQIRAHVGTDIYLRPPETMPGEIATIPETEVDVLGSVPEVAKIGKKLNIPYEGDALLPAQLTEDGKKILAGRGLDSDSADNAAGNMNISIIGSNTPDALSVRGRVTTGLGVTIQPSQPVAITTGRTFTMDEMNADVAVVSGPLAKSNGLSVGDMLELGGVSLEIIGTFEADSGDLFGQNAIFLPLVTAQRVLEQPGAITEAVIYADDVDNVPQVAAAIEEYVPNPNMTTNIEAFDELAGPLQNARQGSQTGMIASLAACIAIILFSMILTVRGRVKEIGILKAVGASNSGVIFQFGAETLMIAIVAAILSGTATYLLAGGIASSMVGTQAIEGLANGSASVSVSPAVFAYSIGIAVILALVGSCIPTWNVARIKPAEVLRYE